MISKPYHFGPYPYPQQIFLILQLYIISLSSLHISETLHEIFLKTLRSEMFSKVSSWNIYYPGKEKSFRKPSVAIIRTCGRKLHLRISQFLPDCGVSDRLLAERSLVSFCFQFSPFRNRSSLFFLKYFPFFLCGQPCGAIFDLVGDTKRNDDLPSAFLGHLSVDANLK